MIWLDGETLRRTLYGTLCEVGVSESSSRHVVDSVVDASVRGVDSHGIRLFPHYVRAVEAGRVNGVPLFKWRSSQGAVGVLDADHAFGHHAGAEAMGWAVDRAGSLGAAFVAVGNSSHFGMAAYFGLMAARQNCIGLAFTNADALVKAHGGRGAIFGTNPICFTAPLQTEEPFCLDMATSLVSWNKIVLSRRPDSRIPLDWAFDEDGQPTTDAWKAKTLSPIGEHKGFGLGMMVEILCSLLADGPYSWEIPPMFTQPLGADPRRISHFFGAIDVAKVTDPEKFKRRLQLLATAIRTVRPLDSSRGVMVPGDPEKITASQRSITGIPVTEDTYADLLSVAGQVSEAVKQ